MASSTSLKISPRSIGIGYFIIMVLVFLLASIGIVEIARKQNSILVEHELRNALRSSGRKIRTGSFREFVESTSFSDGDFYLQIFNILNSETFSSGNTSLQNQGKCKEDNYFEFDIKFCRPSIVPWKYIYVVVGIFILVVLLLCIIFYKLNSLLVKSFKELFSVAEISHDPEMSISTAWRTAVMMASQFQLFQKNAIVQEKNRIISENAKQVAHDIRSPLSALNMIVSSLKGPSPEQMEVMTSAISRINQISNDLLKKSKANIENSNQNTVALKNLEKVNFRTVIETILKEKEYEYSNQNKFRFQIDISQISDLHALCNSIDLGRIISNIINNSIESFKQERIGLITIRGERSSDSMIISFEDNGSGIPEEVCKKLGASAISFGKFGLNSGNGLGIYHAKSTLLSWKGNLEIESKLHVGTKVRITLPLAINT